jgi:hypothetical protein
MIRAFLASALPVLGVGMAVTLVGPDLIVGPSGEPLRVAAPEAAFLQPASFDAASCASTLLLADRQGAADPADGTPGTRVVALSEGAGFIVAIAAAPHDAPTSETLVMIFDETGRLLAAGDPTTLQIDPAGAAMLDNCANGEAPTPTGQI